MAMVSGPVSTAAPTQNLNQATDKRAMSIATMLFFMWGFLTCLNDILIPHLKGIFELNYAQAMLVQFAFFSSYFIFAFPAGKLVEWRGYKQTMVIGLLVMASGALLFLPAAAAASFSLFLSALVILAAGITCLQVSANPYVTNLGPEHTASARLNLAQAFNSLGTTVAPFFGSALILSAAPLAAAQINALPAKLLQTYRMEQASSVRMPYLAIAFALIALAVAIAIVKLPPQSAYTRDFRPGELSTDTRSIWKEKYLVMGAVGIFVYVGAEVSIGSFLVNYLGLPQIGCISEKTADLFVSLYWG
jgi:FHS family L-fucose permease-like MFS transporter